MEENKKRREFLKLMMDTNQNGMSNNKIARLEKTPKQIEEENKEKQRNKKKNDFKNGLIATLAVAGSVAITTGGITACRTHNESQNNKQAGYESELDTDQKDSANIVLTNEEKEQTIKQELEAFEPEDAYRFLKNMYIELYEEKNGESEYTTENITLEDVRYQKYVFVNSITGEYITPGDTPDVTKQKLINDNIYFEIEEDVKVYSIRNNEGKIIDSVSVDNKGVSHKVVRGDQYEETYNSILVDMGEVFVKGLNYANVLENGNEYDKEISKNKFIESLEKQKQAKENQKRTEQQEMIAQIEEDDFEIE